MATVRKAKYIYKDGTYFEVGGDGVDQAARDAASAAQATADSKPTLDQIYPVGSIYLSVDSTSPASLFGGTWERITGCFLLAATDDGAAGGNSSASIAPGGTGGEATHQLNVSEMPSHQHDLERQQWRSVDAVRNTGTGAIYNWRSGNGTGGNTSKSYHDTSTSIYVQYTGGNGAHNNMPPYLAVYVWKRTA